MLTWLKTKYKKKEFETEASLSFNKQWDEREMGMMNPALPLLLRNEELSDLRAGLSSNYGLNIDNRQKHRLHFLANYSFSRNENNVERMKQQVFDGFRNAHEIQYGASYNYHNEIRILIDLKNKHYFSNTVQNYNNFFPSGSVAVYLEDFLNDILDDLIETWYLHRYDLNQLKLFGSAGRIFRCRRLFC